MRQDFTKNTAQWHIWASLILTELAHLFIFYRPLYIVYTLFNFSWLSFLPVPPNGLVVYCGTIVTEEGKEKKVNIDFEPFKPINTSLYLCDNKFHTEVRAFLRVNVWVNVFFFTSFHTFSFPWTQALTALLSDDSKFGFIVIDGSGALFGTLQGNTREVLHKFTVDLPKKHGTSW